MERKMDFGLFGMKTDRNRLKETIRRERKKDLRLGGTKKETLLKLKHTKMDG